MTKQPAQNARLKKSLLASLMLAGVTLSPLAAAYQDGEWVLRVGPTLVEPDEDSGNIKIRRPDLGTVDQAQVGVGTDTQLGVTATYMITSHIGVELLAATPFEHKIEGAGALSGLDGLAKVRQLPPTLTLQYYPLSADSKFQPFLGAGINYTYFFQKDTNDQLTNNIGTLAALQGVNGVVATDTRLHLDDSLGLAVRAGFDYQITDSIGITAGLWWADIDTTAHIKARSNAGTIKADVDVEIDPLVYMVGAVFHF